MAVRYPERVLLALTLAGREIVKLYQHNVGDYMHRWIATLLGGQAIRIHHILRSDADRALHDHPFDFTSFLLTGGYREILTEEALDAYYRDSLYSLFARPRKVEMGPGPNEVTVHHPRFSIIRKRAEDAHRLELDRPIWTIVWSGPRRRPWGFWTPRGWVAWETYYSLNDRIAPDAT